MMRRWLGSTQIQLWMLVLVASFLVACGGDEETPTEDPGANNNNVLPENNNQPDPNNNNNSDPNNSSYEPEPYICDGVTAQGYIAAPDDMCDLLAQDCPEEEGCYLTGGIAECFPPTETTIACGEICDAGNECAPGQICAGDPGRCVAMCKAGGECPGASTCDPLEGRDDLGVCVPPAGGQPCSILDQDCPDDLSCYLIQGREACARPTEEATTVGQSCTEANGCRPGLICVGVEENDLRCLRACDPDNTTACSGDFCTGIEGNDGLGVCF